jgi:hypothetical protein
VRLTTPLATDFAFSTSLPRKYSGSTPTPYPHRDRSTTSLTSHYGPIRVASVGCDIAHRREEHRAGWKATALFAQDSNNGSGGRETVKNESALDLGQSSWSG